MRVAVSCGRLGLVVNDDHGAGSGAAAGGAVGGLTGSGGVDRFVDLAAASGGVISSEPRTLFDCWSEIVSLSQTLTDVSSFPALDTSKLELPMPVPRQAFGIGVNYADHAAEAGMELPPHPMVFTKLFSSLVGPNEVVHSNAIQLDWEAELVVVIGQDCRDVAPAEAWGVVAGLSAGQDVSDRIVQFEGGSSPQMGLGKSAPGFGPIGPWIVSTDEFSSQLKHLELDIRCLVNGVEKQSSNTRHLIFDIPTLVSYLSERAQLLAGDVIFTGTPDGVGLGRRPQEFLHAGDVVTTTIEGIGTMTTRIEAR